MIGSLYPAASAISATPGPNGFLVHEPSPPSVAHGPMGVASPMVNASRARRASETSRGSAAARAAQRTGQHPPNRSGDAAQTLTQAPRQA